MVCTDPGTIQNDFGLLNYEEIVISDRIILIILQTKSKSLDLREPDQKDFQNSILKFGDNM